MLSCTCVSSSLSSSKIDKGLESTLLKLGHWTLRGLLTKYTLQGPAFCNIAKSLMARWRLQNTLKDLLLVNC